MTKTKADFEANLADYNEKRITYRAFISYILDNWADFEKVMPKGRVRAIRLIKPVLKRVIK